MTSKGNANRSQCASASAAPSQSVVGEITKRAQLEGLAPEVTEDDLRTRFCAFGEIAKIIVAREAESAFALITFRTTLSGWNKFVSLFNGSTWKGRKLKVLDVGKRSSPDNFRGKEQKAGNTRNAAIPASTSKKRKHEAVERNDLAADDGTKKLCKLQAGKASSDGSKKLSLGTRTFGQQAQAVGSVERQQDCSFESTKPVGRLMTTKKSSKESDRQKQKQSGSYGGSAIFEQLIAAGRPNKSSRGEKLESSLEGSMTKLGQPASVESSEISTGNKPSGANAVFGHLVAGSVGSLSAQSMTAPLSIVEGLKSLTKTCGSAQLPNAQSGPLLSGNGDDVKANARKKSISTKREHKKAEDNQKRLKAIEQRACETREKRALVSQGLNSRAQTKAVHIIFSDSGSDSDSGKQRLFDSDESVDLEESHEIVVRPVFEGTTGRQRLNLQKRFLGDERFRLTEAFVDDSKRLPSGEKSADQDDKQVMDPREKDDIFESLIKEQSTSLNIIRNMFGNFNNANDVERKKQAWTELVHFDPEASTATNFEVVRPRTETAAGSESDDEPTHKSLAPLPNVSKDVKIMINSDLKNMFAPSVEKTSSFTLFGGDRSKNVKDDASSSIEASQRGDHAVVEADSTLPKSLTFNQHGRLFFFHFDEPELSKRSTYAELNVFRRMEPLDVVISRWEEQRQELTKEYKRKHKSVTRKRKKVNRRS